MRVLKDDKREIFIDEQMVFIDKLIGIVIATLRGAFIDELHEILIS